MKGTSLALAAVLCLGSGAAAAQEATTSAPNANPAQPSITEPPARECTALSGQNLSDCAMGLPSPMNDSLSGTRRPSSSSEGTLGDTNPGSSLSNDASGSGSSGTTFVPGGAAGPLGDSTPNSTLSGGSSGGSSGSSGAAGPLGNTSTGSSGLSD
jgi:hypothetical protein